MHDVRWTRRARRNLNDIGDFIAQDNPTAAGRIVRLIDDQVSRLAEYPRMGRTGRVADTFELVIAGTPYIVIYRIRESVEILRVRHGAQRWP